MSMSDRLSVTFFEGLTSALGNLLVIHSINRTNINNIAIFFYLFSSWWQASCRSGRRESGGHKEYKSGEMGTGECSAESIEIRSP